MLRPTQQIVLDWWDHTQAQADAAYAVWISTPIHMRINTSRVPSVFPRLYEFIDAHFVPKILGVLPAKVQEQLRVEQVCGASYRVMGMIYVLLRYLQPDSIQDKGTVLRQLCSPNVCRDIPAALKELRRWQASLLRAVQLQMGLPGLDQLYTGCRPIFSDIFEQGDVSLQMRWTAMELQNGAPHIRTERGLRDMIRFAES